MSMLSIDFRTASAIKPLMTLFAILDIAEVNLDISTITVIAFFIRVTDLT
jgi:hypothetical protein